MAAASGRMMSSERERDHERTREARIESLHAAAAERILVLDGSWGLKIQELDLSEAEFRGERFAEHPLPLRGNIDLLCLTRPAVVTELLEAYLHAGADIISTNTFTANAISQADYGTDGVVTELNLTAARLARAAAERMTKTDPSQPRWVAGSIGPTNRALSPSHELGGDPATLGDVDFDQLYDAYREQALALHAGGVDLFLVETVFDTLNAKAALKSILDLQDEGLTPLPIWISGTIAAGSGRTRSGQTVDAFWTSVRHAEPFAVGLNCSLGADLMRPHVTELAGAADTLVSVYPNAIDEPSSPEGLSLQLRELAQAGLVNVVGGCCGTTPAHIRAIAEAVAGLPPRPVPDLRPALRLSGLEPLAPS